MRGNHDVNAILEQIPPVKSLDKKSNIHIFNGNLIEPQNQCNYLITVYFLEW